MNLFVHKIFTSKMITLHGLMTNVPVCGEPFLMVGGTRLLCLGPRESRQNAPTYPGTLYLINFIYSTACLFLFLPIRSSHMIKIR